MQSHDSQGYTVNSAQVAHSRRGKPSAEHEAVIDLLCAERGARRKGFAAFVRQLGRAVYANDGGRIPVRLVPDAWLVAPQMATLLAIEVENRHRVAHDKIAAYYEIARALDDCEWDLKVATFDHRGNPGEEIDPCVYFQVGRSQARRPLIEAPSWQLL